jgi:hypothetical protein
MVILMRVIGLMIWLMEEEGIFMLMELFMMVNGFKINKMVMA